jgi:ParB family chromosome partitioning protein
MGGDLPARRADLLPWLIEQDPGTTLLDLLAFCTASLVNGISDTEKPHAINAISNVLELDMTRYWTPTRASYFDHVSKAHIIDVVTNAVSPKAAADLQKMKKGDAAAAAELRLAQVKWLPEILTDQTFPIVNHFDPDDEDEDHDESDASDGDIENGDTGGDSPKGDVGNDADGVNGGDNADGTDPSATNSTVGNGESCLAVVAETPAWPFPTAASVEAQQRMR